MKEYIIKCWFMSNSWRLSNLKELIKIMEWNDVTYISLYSLQSWNVPYLVLPCLAFIKNFYFFTKFSVDFYSFSFETKKCWTGESLLKGMALYSSPPCPSWFSLSAFDSASANRGPLLQGKAQYSWPPCTN
jgi:hypothetical protein